MLSVGESDEAQMPFFSPVEMFLNIAAVLACPYIYIFFKIVMLTDGIYTVALCDFCSSVPDPCILGSAAKAQVSYSKERETMLFIIAN